MAVETVGESVAPIAAKIFANRERMDVADASPVEIAGGRVMDRVEPPPVVVGRHGDDADRPADPVVGGLARKEPAMPAVVLDHEEAGEQPRGERRHGERQPDLAIARGDQHRGPQRDEGQDGDREFEDAARRVRLAIGSERPPPVARRRRTVSFDRRHTKTPTRANGKAWSSGSSTAPGRTMPLLGRLQCRWNGSEMRPYRPENAKSHHNLASAEPQPRDNAETARFTASEAPKTRLCMRKAWPAGRTAAAGCGRAR